MTKASHFTIHSCKFRQLHDFTGEVVMSHLHEHHPPTHDVTRHAESRPKRVTSHYPEICDDLEISRPYSLLPTRNPERAGSAMTAYIRIHVNSSRTV